MLQSNIQKKRETRKKGVYPPNGIQRPRNSRFYPRNEKMEKTRVHIFRCFLKKYYLCSF